MEIVVKKEERLRKMEKISESIRAELPDVQEKALVEAVERKDEETAAWLARSIRDRLLKESDKEVALDRLGLEAPAGTAFTAWLDFLRKLAEALVNNWAMYRQELRDLPEQEGFPFDIKWPVKPGTRKERNE